MRGAVSSATGRRYPLTMICAVFHVRHSTVYRTLAPAVSAPPVAARAEDAVERCRRRRGDPRGAGGEPVPRRRLSEGPRPLGPSGPGHRRETRVALDARVPPARAPAARTAQWRSGARRHDHHQAPGRDLGHRRDAVLHRGGWLVLVRRRQVFGRFAKDVARGLRIRCDWDPQYIADAWINEVKWLGMSSKPNFS
jgi:hypothetical protein